MLSVSACLPLKTDNKEKNTTTMQDLSSQNKKTSHSSSVISPSKDFVMEGIEPENDVKASQENTPNKNFGCENFSDAIFYDQTSEKNENTSERRRAIGSTFRKENSASNIPSVPDIVVEHVSATSLYNTSINSTSEKVSQGFTSVGQKKLRTSADSTTYELESTNKSGPSLRIFNCSGVESSLDFLTHIETSRHDVLKRDQDEKTKRQDLTVIQKQTLWNCNSFINKFSLGQEKSPKTYWLRRHSDSNVTERQEKKGLCVESHAATRSHSASALEEDEHVIQEEEANETLKDDPIESCSAQGMKWKKVKKYLQTRYQMSDVDDVFTDRPLEEFPRRVRDVLEEEEDTSPETPLSLRSETDVEENAISLHQVERLQWRLKLSPCTGLPQSPKYQPGNDFPSSSPIRILDPRTKPPYFDQYRPNPTSGCESFSRNNSPIYPGANAVPSIFTFNFPSPNPDLHDLPVNTDNFIYNLFPHGRLPSPFLPSHLTLENFTFRNPVSPCQLASTSIVMPESSTMSMPSPKKLNKSSRQQQHLSTKLASTKENDEDLLKMGRRGLKFLENRSTICHPSTTSADISNEASDTSLVERGFLNDDSQPQNLTLSPISKSISLNPALHLIQSSLPSSPLSSPLVATSTKSNLQVVFDYQFSERINEQKRAAGCDTNSNFVCPMCGNVFLSYNSLANHMVSHLPSEVITTQDGNNGSKVHLCKVCNRSFSRCDMLSRHMRLHTGLRPYECHLCRQVFSRSDHLHTHLRTHTGEKPYRCSHCMYAAPRRDMVTRHMRVHLRGCTKRGRRSSSASSLISESSATKGNLDSTNDGELDDVPSKQNVSSSSCGGRNYKTTSSFKKSRNWSVTSSETSEGPAPDRETSKMIRTESTTSIDSGVSYLTPMSLAPSLWSPGVDSPDVFSRQPLHFIWPTTTQEMRHESEEGSLSRVANKDVSMDAEMQESFQKWKVTSPASQSSSKLTDDFVNFRR